MPFEDLLTPRKSPGTKCKTCYLIAKLEPAVQEEVRAAILSGKYGDETIADGLAQVSGESLSKTSTRKHRMGNHA